MKMRGKLAGMALAGTLALGMLGAVMPPAVSPASAATGDPDCSKRSNQYFQSGTTQIVWLYQNDYRWDSYTHKYTWSFSGNWQAWAGPSAGWIQQKLFKRCYS